jgi:hypothetical protein
MQPHGCTMCRAIIKQVDNETLMFLLKGGHINMPDRIARGAWPHSALPFDTVATYLAEALEQGDVWFPYQWEPARTGQPVREGGTIERQANDQYIYRNAAAHPGSPTTISRSVERVFSNARDAAIHYLKWTLHLPWDLDGWKVV